MLTLRGRTPLTQQQLGGRLGVSTRTIQYWETGVSSPASVNLKALIVLFVEYAAFTSGAERQEAEALWEAASLDAARLAAAFDRGWFDAVLASHTHPSVAPPTRDAPAEQVDYRRQDWGEAPQLATLYGRSTELETLRHWVVDERCRLVMLVGMGGIGKTALASRLSLDVAPEFDIVYWRSVGLGLPPQVWLARTIAYLSGNQLTPPGDPSVALIKLTELLTARRCLLVLDNFETVLETGDAAARYRADSVIYGDVLRYVAESNHNSCLIGTSREKPPDFAQMEGRSLPTRSFRVGGLSVDATRDLLREKDLAADRSRWELLVERYGGNALALKVVAETIDEIFFGDVGDFLTQADAVFGDIRRLLDEHLQRLSPLELEILYWLAIERQPLSLATLQTRGRLTASRAETLEAFEALRRRSLVERHEAAATFMLQPVVLEYISEHLIAAAAHEITTDRHEILRRFPLVLGMADDWIRRSQERLLAEPTLKRLALAYGSEVASEQHLIERLDSLRTRSPRDQGWEPGTLVNLLRLQRGHLRGVDLSELHLRQVYLQEVDGQDASLAHAELRESLVTDTFNFIRALALSADGAYVAAGSANGEVRLWRAADRTLLLAARAHTSMVFSVGISADGRMLASGGADGAIRLWHTADGSEAGRLLGHIGMVHALALSSDGTLLLSGGRDGSVRMWAVPSEECVAFLPFENNSAKLAVALSKDGRIAACGCVDGTVEVYDLVERVLLARSHAHAGAVRGVSLDASGETLASGGDDGRVRVWHAKRGVPLVDLHASDGAIYSVALSDDGRLCISGAETGVVRVWETATGQCIATLAEHSNLVFSVGLTADGRTAASGGLDGTLRLWNVPAGRCSASIHSYMGGIRSISFSGDGELFATGGINGAVRLWSTRSGALERTLQTSRHELMALTLSHDARLLCVAGLGPVQTWSTSNAVQLQTLTGHSGMVYGVRLPNDAGFAATGGIDGSLRLWDLNTGECRAILARYDTAIDNIALSGDGQLVAASVLGQAFELWSTESQRKIATFPMSQGGSSWAIALSEDGRVLAGGGGDGFVRAWDTATEQCLLSIAAHSGGTLGCALSRDGRRLATSGGDGQVRVWSVESGEPLATWQEHTGGVWAVDISRDGDRVISGGLDGTIRVWDPDRPTSVHVLRADRPYERMDVTGLTGVTEAQRRSLLALGAIEGSG